jgi:hypothetical protein
VLLALADEEIPETAVRLKDIALIYKKYENYDTWQVYR